MTNVPVYDLPQSPILIIGFFGILFTLVLLYFVNRAYFESPLNRDRRSKTDLLHSVEKQVICQKSVSTHLI